MPVRDRYSRKKPAGKFDPRGGDIADVERLIAYHERKRADDLAYIERYSSAEFPDAGITNAIAAHDRELKKLRAKLARLTRKRNPTMAAKKKAKRKATPAQLRALKKGRATLKKKRAATKRNPAYGNYKKARAVARGSRKVNPAPKKRLYVIASADPKASPYGSKIQWWTGKDWANSYRQAAEFTKTEYAFYVAKKHCKRACAIVLYGTQDHIIGDALRK